MQYGVVLNVSVNADVDGFDIDTGSTSIFIGNLLDSDFTSISVRNQGFGRLVNCTFNSASLYDFTNLSICLRIAFVVPNVGLPKINAQMIAHLFTLPFFFIGDWKIVV